MKSFRGAVHLHMNWNQIIIYMGRRALLRHVQRHLSRRHRHARDSSSVPNQEDAGSSPSAAATTCEATLIRECVAAAIRIIQLVNYLWETGKLARFSFTDLNCCSTATLIVMVHEIAQQHPLYSSSVETAMQAMSHMATGCRNAKEGLRLIRHLQRVITALKSEMAHDERGTDGQMHGYREWERWMALRDDNAASSSVAATPSVRPTAGEARMKQGEYMVGEDFHGASSASVDSGLMPVSSLEEMSGTVGTEQSVFMGPWTDNLDSLGLSGFEDFTFPSF
ncbi:hypothetical protein VTK73DRAFT_6884 [Phialemonium thermophilum]|uniref:Uncharacterized protein n=1 Tax=Phialemonium thermophilum TaxID=223376 RepID=A0ABR3WHJ7_9PEZI